MDHSAKDRIPNLAILSSFLLTGFIFICVSNTQTFFPHLQNSQSHDPSTNYTMGIYRDELEEALAKSSTQDKTVILTVVNKAYVDGHQPMLDLFLDGFWLGEDTQRLIDHLLVVAMDQTSFERCKFLKLHCYKLKTEGVDFDKEQLHMSDGFVKMMWRRTQFLGDVLKHGYNFIFTDTDILWLRNPFPRLALNDTLDLQISVDQFNGDEWSQSRNYMNTGFYMMKSNKKTMALLDEVYRRKDNSSGQKEQDVMNNIMYEGTFVKLGVNVQFLDTMFFSGFCQDSKDAALVVTVHSNCCQHISAKLTDLTAVLHDWKRFKHFPKNETTMFRWSNGTSHVACLDSWKH